MTELSKSQPEISPFLLDHKVALPGDVGDYIGVFQDVADVSSVGVIPVDRVTNKPEDAYAVERASMEDIPEGVLQDYEARAKSEKLHLLHDVLNEEVAHGGAKIWSEVARNLLIRSQQIDLSSEEQEAYLVGSVVASQFIPLKDNRVQFVRNVYNLGLQDQLAAACESTPVALLYGNPKENGKLPVHPLSDFASAFRIDDKYVRAYLASGNNVLGPGGVKTQAELVKQIAAGKIDEATLTHAAMASVRGEKVAGIVDTTKIERFALEQFFIHKQMLVLLDGADPAKTPFSSYLVDQRELSAITAGQGANNARHAKRSPNTALLDKAILQLNADVTGAFMDLSNDLAHEFDIRDLDTSDRSKLTEEQNAALRYRYVTRQIEGQKALGRFIDFEEFMGRSKDTAIHSISESEDDQIWSGPLAGAALPALATGLVKNVIRGALNSRFASNISPEELRDFTQRERKTLIAAATLHNEEAPSHNMAPPEVKLGRNEQGELELANNFEMPQRGMLDLYAAIALGCPALREQNPSREVIDAEERLAHGSSNYIDQLLAAVINEAYDRGLFNVRTFQFEEYRYDARHARVT